MACDPVTFGPGSAPAADGTGFSVLWIRDSAPNSVSAYRIPDGYCPFPSRLTYTGITTASPGQALPICFALKSMSAGVQQPLGKQPVQITFNGADLGSGMTDSNGTLCRPATAPVAGGAFAATARFAGHNAYPASTADASVGVLPQPNHPPGAGTVGAGVLPPSSLGAPGAGPQLGGASEPATGAAAQSEAQAQVRRNPRPRRSRRRRCSRG